MEKQHKLDKKIKIQKIFMKTKLKKINIKIRQPQQNKVVSIQKIRKRKRKKKRKE